MKNFIFIILLAACQLHSQDRITGELFATRSEVIAQNGMVASSHPLATQIGIEILKNGGNAIDAAIAVNAALGLMEPTGCGIGGDLFAIVWDPKAKKLHGLNASGPSPHSLSLDYFLDNDYEGIPFYGVLPVSVAGAVAADAGLSRIRIASYPIHLDHYHLLPIRDRLDRHCGGHSNSTHRCARWHKPE